MKRLPIIIFCLILVALLSVGCFSKAADEISNEATETTGASPKESQENPENSGTNVNQEPQVENQDTPAVLEANIIVDEPKEGQVIKSGGKVIIKGKTRLQEFDIEVEDGHEILGTAHISVQKSQELEEFEATIEIGEHTSPSGMIIFVTEDQDGKRQEQLLLPVKFE